jgi:preprotein translocase subunit YajC
MEGSGSLVVLVLMVGVFYFLLIRPQQRRLKALQSLQSSLQLGDEIITSAGFLGTIRRFDGEVVTIELSPGVEARVNRRAISGKVNPEPVAEAAEASELMAERAKREGLEIRPALRESVRLKLHPRALAESGERVQVGRHRAEVEPVRPPYRRLTEQGLDGG